MVSIVITSHQDEKGLYLTHFGLREQLEKSVEPWEIILVCDGGSETKWENLPGTRCLRGHFGSPQASRDAGIRAAKSKAVIVVEAHVIVSDIIGLVKSHRDLGGAMTFPYRHAEGPELFDVYGCATDWDGNLWFKNLVYTKASMNPYRISQFGNSCFAIDRSAYIEVGGYTKLLNGWGGEEPLLALKFWMLGYELWFDPRIWHAHFLTVGAHPGRITSEEFTENMLKVAYVIGGYRQLGQAKRRYPNGMFHMTPELAEERKRIEEGPFHGDIERLRNYFMRESIN